jgi:aarF domain-containing kinase
MATSASLDAWLSTAAARLQELPSLGEAAMVIEIIVADTDAVEEHQILVDLRDGVTERLVRRLASSPATTRVQAEARLRVSMGTLFDLADGRLAVVKAFMQKKVVLERGNLTRFRRLGTSLESWLRSFESSSPAPSAVQVRVTHAAVHPEGGHGVYTLRISEGAAAWMVVRRWSQLRALQDSLRHETEHLLRGDERPLPLLPRAYMRRSGSLELLRKRPAQIEEYLRAVLQRVPCSPQAGLGPRCLLAFLDDAAMHQPPIASAVTTAWATTLAANKTTANNKTTSISGLSSPRTSLGSSLGMEEPPELSDDLGRDAASAALRAERFSTLLLRGRLEEQASALVALESSSASSQRAWAACVGALAVSLGMGLTGRMAQLAAVLVVSTALITLFSALIPPALMRRIQLLRRYVAVAALFAHIAIQYKYVTLWRCRKASAAARAATMAAFNEWLGALLCRRISKLGGFYLKLGQYLASRSDLVPEALVRHLSTLLDRNEPRPLPEVLATLTEAWGPSGADQLEALEPTCLSCGSIAQVHVGWLRSPGGAPPRKVAVKVQHRDIAPVMLQDLAQSEVLAYFLALLEPTFDFAPIIKEINVEHKKELDFGQERANLVDVRRNFGKGGRVPVTVPELVEELTNERVLVMEFCEGHSLKDGAELRRLGVHCETLVMRVCEAWAAMMFRDGCFNADAHAGNLLVHLDPQLGPVPVLLDFGLCKRLDYAERIALCQMVHSLEELDGDLLLHALLALGFVMNAAEIEPTEVFRDLLFLFRESRADAQEARDQFNQKLEDDMRRQKVYSQEAKQHVQQGLKPPVEALPGVVIFFVRALEMLQGLCTRLEVAVPFMRPMAQHAAATLLADAASKLLTTALTTTATAGQRWLHVGQPSSFRSASSSLKATLRPAPKASLHERTLRLLHAFSDSGELLGAQVCVVRSGHTLVDAAAGRMGPVDPRPVVPNTLFQLFQAGAPCLAALVLLQVERGVLSLDETISATWPGFSAGGKGALTVAQLLRHGLPGAKTALMPKRARLRQLLELPAMEAYVAAASLDGAAAAAAAAVATAAHDGATGGGAAGARAPTGEFEGAPWGWVLSGLLRAASGGSDVHALLADLVCTPLELGPELRLKVAPEEAAQVARHSIATLMQELQLDMSNLEGFAGSASPPDEPAVSAGTPSGSGPPDPNDPFAASAGSIDWERFQGPAQLMNPATFNSAAVREAGVPGCAMLGSARALANFYAALASGRTLGKNEALRRRLVADPTAGWMDDEPVQWGLGMQVGSIRSMSDELGSGVASPGVTTVLGHRGLGGTVGFAIPAASLGVAITVSRLSTKREVTRRLLELVLEDTECGGWRLPSGGLL